MNYSSRPYGVEPTKLEKEGEPIQIDIYTPPQYFDDFNARVDAAGTGDRVSVMTMCLAPE